MRRTKPLVLVIEDDDDVRDAIVDAVEDRGFAALSAWNGEEALALLDGLDGGTMPDVIVLDLMMPVLDGYAFLAARAENPRLSSIPVVVASAAPPSRTLAASTWNEFIAKPFAIEALLTAIERASARRRSA